MVIKHIELNAHPGGLSRLSIVVDGDRTALGEIVSKAQADPDKWELYIKKKGSKRGLTANAYYWALVEDLAKVLMTSKDEMHTELIQRYGAIKKKDGSPVVFSLVAGQDPNTVTPYAKSFAEGMANGKRIVHYCVLKGSSEMDASEFGRLLDGCISECKEQGIETMRKEDIERLEYLNPASPGHKEKS